MNAGASSLPCQRVRAVIFDLDDTLLASGHLESFRLSRNRQGLEEVLPHLSAPSGLHDQLRRLGQHLPLGVVTSAPRWYAERILAHLYPDVYWKALVTYGDVPRRKPDPQGLMLALSHMNLSPSTDVAYVGDQETDLEAARRAGLLPMQAAWCCDVGRGQELYLQNPAELECLQPGEVQVSAASQELLTLLQLPSVGKSTVLKAFSEQRLGLTGMPAYSDKKIQAALDQPGAWEKAVETAQMIMAACQASGVRLLSPADPAYPTALLGMSKRKSPSHNRSLESPAILYVQGRLSPRPGLAVVGTREPTRHGLEITRRMVTHFSTSHSIVSGLALGVDSMAHQAAVEAGGHTVAVLGHGHEKIFPKQNAGLAQTILESGGALVSEYAPGIDVKPYQFVERDRIQAGLADATIMVQTDLEGGSWHAARKALAYGRLLGYPVPTQRDVSSGESKVQGILLLERGTPDEKAGQLECPVSDLDRVFRICGKEDYATFALRSVQGYVWHE